MTERKLLAAKPDQLEVVGLRSFRCRVAEIVLLVYVERRLLTRDYRDRDRVRRWVTTIVVNRLQALDHRRAEQQ
jgi:single-stranded DNA-binding protein